MTHVQDAERQPHLIHGYRGWWIGIAALSFTVGLMILGDVPSAIGFLIGAIILPGVLSAVVWAFWKVLRRPLTPAQTATTFIVAWALMVGLTLIGRLG